MDLWKNRIGKRMSCRGWCLCAVMALLVGSVDSVKAQQYAGFMEEIRNATTDSLMNIGGIEYYLLYENYENVHFLSLLSENREVAQIGPATPADTLFQNGNICGKLGIETVRRPLVEMRNDSMLVTNKFPWLFARCESVSPCNFKACDTNNFGYKILVDFPTGEGDQWDFLRFWIINYVDSFTNMDMLYYEDVYLEKNLDKGTLPTEMIRKAHPEAFEIEDINDGQAVVDHFRDMYMRQVYYLKNQDFTFPLSYLRIFMTPRHVDSRYVTYFVSTNFYAYGAHDFPLERYVTFDMKNKEALTNDRFFKPDKLDEVKRLLTELMEEKGYHIGEADLPQVALFGDQVVFSFQPYQIGAFVDGITHFTVGKEKLKKWIFSDRWW